MVASHKAEQGGVVLIVGPSGAGKDTLIGLARAALAAEGRLVFSSRVITRPPSAAEANVEVSPEAFAAARARGAFCLSWRAHGLDYAIPATALEAARRGCVVVANVSRAVVEAARRELPGVSVVEITADPDILAARLAGRQREAAGDQQARLARQAAANWEADLTIANDGDPGAAAARLIGHLRRRLAAGGGADA